ncbi:Peptidoglycan-binding lysin domain [Macleaya cordata]|uniref:Peptidoglycan-binding lysin domain n=1 Tax=Macleaya cordata TaxID=56857 RepID=A0A200Q5H2_MACCD|nr:Peptidoglycan-binding lysin domain [Macleaya cordata]
MSSNFSLVSSSSSNSVSNGGGGGGAVNYIEHHVSKMDTLAGVAIKYGVEVADIKRMNGLVTDLQMFALKSLQIPLPGRHPPSASLSNGLGTPGGFSAVTGRGLALRPKSVSRNLMAADSDISWLNPIPVGLGDSLMTDGFVAVRKSSSTSNLQDQDNNGSASIWPTTRWSLKPDLQALSSATAITRPIFDGLPKPVNGRRNKAALD